MDNGDREGEQLSWDARQIPLQFDRFDLLDRHLRSRKNWAALIKVWTVYIKTKAGVTEEETAYMGDDLPDIPLAVRAGLAVAVADAAVELKAVCHLITNARGGHGSAREVIELILKAQGRWDEAVPKALA